MSSDVKKAVVTKTRSSSVIIFLWTNDHLPFRYACPLASTGKVLILKCNCTKIIPFALAIDIVVESIVAFCTVVPTFTIYPIAAASLALLIFIATIAERIDVEVLTVVVHVPFSPPACWIVAGMRSIIPFWREIGLVACRISVIHVGPVAVARKDDATSRRKRNL